MEKKLSSILLLLAATFITNATTPKWNVNVHAYSNSMTITGIVNILGNELTNSSDSVAAFVGTECRGVAALLPSSTLGHSYAMLQIYSNSTGEKISFKVFHNSDGRIINISDNCVFTSDASLGTFETPYVFSDKTVNGTSIFTFSLGITGETSVIDSVNRTIMVTVPRGIDVTSVTPLITSSIGSRIMIAGGVELSVNTVLNFTQTETISIIAQNGIKDNWTIIVDFATQIDEIWNKKYNISLRNDGTLAFSNFSETAKFSVYTLVGDIIYQNGSILSSSLFSLKNNVFYLVVVKANNETMLCSKIVVK